MGSQKENKNKNMRSFTSMIRWIHLVQCRHDDGDDDLMMIGWSLRIGLEKRRIQCGIIIMILIHFWQGI